MAAKHWIVTSGVACALLAAPVSLAFAQSCTQPGASAVGGTLASPSPPCPNPSTRPLAAPRTAPQPQGQKPGTFQHGNTTIHIGGSISTEVGARGGR